MATITAVALKTRIAELLEVPKKDADDILWALQAICTDAVKNGDTLILPNIGRLSCQVRAARTARNPRTGDPIKVPAKVVVKFKVNDHLADNAPSLKKRVGKELLAEAEAKQAQREKAKRKREREAAQSEKSSKRVAGTKAKSRKSPNKKRRAAARF